MFSAIKAIGAILLGFGIVQIGLALKGHDAAQRAQGFMTFFGGVVIYFANELSAHFLYVSWKRFRKYNAYATGITQSVQDCLSNDTAYAMLANSEFVVLLRQTKDIDSVAELYGLSEPQKNYLLLARPGQGILKLGNSLIPFENEYPKNKTYQLLTTKPGEMEQ